MILFKYYNIFTVFDINLSVVSGDERNTWIYYNCVSELAYLVCEHEDCSLESVKWSQSLKISFSKHSVRNQNWSCWFWVIKVIVSLRLFLIEILSMSGPESGDQFWFLTVRCSKWLWSMFYRFCNRWTTVLTFRRYQRSPQISPRLIKFPRNNVNYDKILNKSP